ncbi:MAG: nucleotidyltransferase domain-containing protein [Acidobacteria bacterium]|nr:nucleotidyltransferase domain-containing protein [Acidobacteriota bacterium]
MPKGGLLTAREAAAVDRFLAGVRQAFGSNLLAVKLFGSKVRGDSTPESDIDILLEVGEATVVVEDQAVDIAFDVNLEYDVYISPRVIARSTLNHPVWRLTGFVQALEREGVPL